jgi:gliding motility-associated-like protein
MNKAVFMLCLCYLTGAEQGFAQMERYIWYFGNKAGLSFHTSPPTVLTGGKINTREGSAVANDADGNLLFYTDGATVWNRNHSVMPNGTALNGHWSSTESALIIPEPGSATLYYIFTTTAQGLPYGLCYSIVDMSLSGGLGSVVLKNVVMHKPVAEKLAAVQHKNGKDYWVTCHEWGNNTFRSYRFTSAGIDTQNVVISNVGTREVQKGASGAIQFSSDGNRLAAAYIDSNYSNSSHTGAELYDFDKATGIISHPLFLDYPKFGTSFNQPYYVLFSPNNRFLYISDFTGKVLQVDLQVGDTAQVRASVKCASPPSATLPFFGMQNGPDGRLYLARGYSSIGNSSMAIIPYPDLLYPNCGYFDPGIVIYPDTVCLGLPNFAAVPFLMKAADLCYGDSTAFTFAPATTVPVSWNFGDPVSGTANTSTASSPKHKFANPGTYYVTLTRYHVISSEVDTIQVKIGKKFVVYLGSDTAFCGKFSLLLNAGKGAMSYHWNTGDTTVSILVNQPGMYAVTVKDSNSCPSGDTILVDRLLPPLVSIRYDSISCKYVYLGASPRQQGVDYSWSTGDTSLTIKVAEKGTYTLTAKNLFCSIVQSIAVTKLPAPDVYLGNDTDLCAGSPILLTCNDGDSILWSTGSRASGIAVTQAGTYWVNAWRNQCSAGDTIQVSNECEFTCFIPDAFTPTHDGLNEIFKVVGVNIDHIDMQIYNRWGEKIYEGLGKDPGWDGTYNGLPAQQDTYVYLIRITGVHKGLQVVRQVSGNITLLR